MLTLVDLHGYSGGLVVEGHELAADSPGLDGVVVARVHAQARGVDAREHALVQLHPLARVLAHIPAEADRQGTGRQV